MPEAVIVATARSPIGRAVKGSLKDLRADDLAATIVDAALSKAACKRVAVAAQDGLARTMRPSHTPLDGDTVFALSTGAVEVSPASDTPAAMSPETKLTTRVGATAADCLASAVLAAVLAAETIAGVPSYRDLLPGAFTT